ncbi:tRNA-(ms[2]io[6]A)-hydroxylase [Myxococcota bacterium]|nr:tRNA-(ms[2]io[6]A)-hydroxylase [Myxococcota bacterium]
MLHLAAATEARWVERALAAMPEILLDHAHCEKKAASMAMTLMFRYPDHASLIVPLSRLAREELGHFEEVLRQLEVRGIPFRRQRPSPYAGKLMEAVRQKEPHRILDMLLTCAFIEARSCERMRLLSEALAAPDPELATLYRGLLAAEARHHRLFIDLALGLGLFSKDEVDARIEELAAHEASVIADAPDEPRMHN